jgi:hypothetical protein
LWDVTAIKRDLTLAQWYGPRNRPNQRTLARAIWTDTNDDFPSLRDKRHIRKCRMLLIFTNNIFYVNH